jgi:hypothetical protein
VPLTHCTCTQAHNQSSHTHTHTHSHTHTLTHSHTHTLTHSHTHTLTHTLNLHTIVYIPSPFHAHVHQRSHGTRTHAHPDTRTAQRHRQLLHPTWRREQGPLLPGFSSVSFFNWSDSILQGRCASHGPPGSLTTTSVQRCSIARILQACGCELMELTVWC